MQSSWLLFSRAVEEKPYSHSRPGIWQHGVPFGHVRWSFPTLGGQYGVPGASCGQICQPAASTGDRLQSHGTAPSRGHIFSRQRKCKSWNVWLWKWLYQLSDWDAPRPLGDSEQIWKKEKPINSQQKFHTWLKNDSSLISNKIATCCIKKENFQMCLQCNFWLQDGGKHRNFKISDCLILLCASFPPKLGVEIKFWKGNTEMGNQSKGISFELLIFFNSYFFLLFANESFLLWKISNIHKNRITQWIPIHPSNTFNNSPVLSHFYLYTLPFLLFYFKDNLRHDIISSIIFHHNSLLSTF